MLINTQIGGSAGGVDVKYNATIDAFLGDVDGNGVLQAPTEPTEVIFTGVKGIASIGDSRTVLFRIFQSLPSIEIIRFPDLEDLDVSSALTSMCDSCTGLSEIYFNSITGKSFGFNYYNQFTNMLTGCANVTIHVPLGTDLSFLQGYPNFGGTNTFIMDDLPAV